MVLLRQVKKTSVCARATPEQGIITIIAARRRRIPEHRSYPLSSESKRLISCAVRTGAISDVAGPTVPHIGSLRGITHRCFEAFTQPNPS